MKIFFHMQPKDRLSSVQQKTNKYCTEECMLNE